MWIALAMLGCDQAPPDSDETGWSFGGQIGESGDLYDMDACLLVPHAFEANPTLLAELETLRGPIDFDGQPGSIDLYDVVGTTSSWVPIGPAMCPPLPFPTAFVTVEIEKTGAWSETIRGLAIGQPSGELSHVWAGLEREISSPTPQGWRPLWVAQFGPGGGAIQEWIGLPETGQAQFLVTVERFHQP